MKKIITTFILIISILFFIYNVVSAYNLDLNLSSDKSSVKVGDKVTLKLKLSQGMQAADFVINYDSSLLKFDSTSLGENFYSTKEPGKIICSWFDVKDNEEFTFSFTAINSGNANFSTTTENFYDGNLQSASMYNEGKLSLNLLQSANISTAQSNINKTTNNTNNNSNLNTSNSTLKTNNSPVVYQSEQPISTTSNIETSKSVLPQTGSNSNSLVIISFVIMIFAIILRIKINKLKDI